MCESPVVVMVAGSGERERGQGMYEKKKRKEASGIGGEERRKSMAEDQVKDLFTSRRSL